MVGRTFRCLYWVAPSKVVWWVVPPILVCWVAPAIPVRRVAASISFGGTHLPSRSRQLRPPLSYSSLRPRLTALVRTSPVDVEKLLLHSCFTQLRIPLVCEILVPTSENPCPIVRNMHGKLHRNLWKSASSSSIFLEEHKSDTLEGIYHELRCLRDTRHDPEEVW